MPTRDVIGAPGPGSLAALSNTPDVALLHIMQFALNDINLLALSTVCRRWSEVVRLPGCWKRKKIDIVGRPMSRQAIRAWYPRWREGLVSMTYKESDLLEA